MSRRVIDPFTPHERMKRDRPYSCNNTRRYLFTGNKRQTNICVTKTARIKVQYPPLNSIRLTSSRYAFVPVAATFSGLARYLRHADHFHCASDFTNADAPRSRYQSDLKHSNGFCRSSSRRTSNLRHAPWSNVSLSPPPARIHDGSCGLWLLCSLFLHPGVG